MQNKLNDKDIAFSNSTLDESSSKNIFVEQKKFQNLDLNPILSFQKFDQSQEEEEDDD